MLKLKKYLFTNYYFLFRIIKRRKKIVTPVAEKPGDKKKNNKKAPSPEPEPEPEPETPQKFKRSEVKKIIIPKKKTLLKRAQIEARRKAREIEAAKQEPEPEKEPDSKFPKKDGDNSKLDESNILTGSRTRHQDQVSFDFFFQHSY